MPSSSLIEAEVGVEVGVILDKVKFYFFGRVGWVGDWRK